MKKIYLKYIISKPTGQPALQKEDCLSRIGYPQTGEEMHISRRILISALVIALSGMYLHAGWVIETLDGNAVDETGRYNSIRLDSAGNPHIAYSSNPATDDFSLKYSSKTVSAWSACDVAGPGKGSFCSLALNSQGRPYISHFGFPNLYISSYSSTGWSTSVVDQPAGMEEIGRYTSIAVDTNGIPHMAYQQKAGSNPGSKETVRYTSSTASGWYITDISTASLDSPFYTISMALDANNVPHAAFVKQGEFIVKCASWTGTAWHVNNVADAGSWNASAGSDLSIAIGTNNSLHIAYTESTGLDLKYAQWTGTKWSTTTVDSTGDVGKNCAIALDSANKPGISYYDRTNGKLKCARWDGSWTLHTIDTMGTYDAEVHTSIAIDSNNNPHIAYAEYNEAGGWAKLKYTKFSNAPVLSWAGGTGYDTDGVNPDTGVKGNTFTFKVKYTDTESEAPLASYPRLRILKGGTTVQMLLMNHESGSYNTGAVYSTSTVIHTEGSDYTYYFEALDSNSDPAVGAAAGMTAGPAVALTNTPLLTWTGNSDYVSDGVNPDNEIKNTVFAYKVRYTDVDNDAPKAGYPKLRVLKGGATVYTLMMSSETGSDYSGGMIYSTSTVILSSGTDYTYYFEAYDSNDAPATGTATGMKQGPIVRLTNAPVLSWEGSAGYLSDGVNPDIAARNSVFSFKVKYSDADNEAPLSGYPKVYVLRGGTTAYMFVLNMESGSYAAGAIYSTSTVLVSSGTEYTYHFSAYDINNAEATGSPANMQSGPVVELTNAPVLSWTGEAGYTFSGVSPSSGTKGTTFSYRVKYSDTDNDAPFTGYPKLHILKGGATVQFLTMTYVSGTCTAGAMYSISYAIDTLGADFTYVFEAYDANGVKATGTASQAQAGPGVYTNKPVLSWTGETNYVSDGVNPDMGAKGIFFSYRIKYTDADNEEPKAGYPKLRVLKDGATVQLLSMNFESGSYSGGAVYSTSTVLVSSGTDYSYYFEAYDINDTSASGEPLDLRAGPTVVSVQAGEIEGLIATVKENSARVIVAGIPVEAYLQNTKVAETVTDINGKYKLAVNNAGTYKVRAFYQKASGEFASDSYQTAVLSQSAGAGGIDFTLSLYYILGIISGQVLGEGLVVEVVKSGNIMGAAVSGTGGSYVIGDLLPGTYSVRVLRGKEILCCRTVTLLEGQTLSDIDFESGFVSKDKVYVYPNPSDTGKVTVHFELTAVPLSAELKIFKVSGEYVHGRLLGQEFLTSGPAVYDYSWDCRDDAGRGLPAGIYLFCLDIEDISGKADRIIRRFTILR